MLSNITIHNIIIRLNLHSRLYQVVILLSHKNLHNEDETVLALPSANRFYTTSNNWSNATVQCNCAQSVKL